MLGRGCCAALRGRLGGRGPCATLRDRQRARQSMAARRGGRRACARWLWCALPVLNSSGAKLRATAGATSPAASPGCAPPYACQAAAGRQRGALPRLNIHKRGLTGPVHLVGTTGSDGPDYRLGARRG
jgi:hypothetical protein